MSRKTAWTGPGPWLLLRFQTARRVATPRLSGELRDVIGRWSRTVARMFRIGSASQPEEWPRRPSGPFACSVFAQERDAVAGSLARLRRSPTREEAGPAGRVRPTKSKAARRRRPPIAIAQPVVAGKQGGGEPRRPTSTGFQSGAATASTSATRRRRSRQMELRTFGLTCCNDRQRTPSAPTGRGRSCSRERHRGRRGQDRRTGWPRRELRPRRSSPARSASFRAVSGRILKIRLDRVGEARVEKNTPEPT